MDGAAVRNGDDDFPVPPPASSWGLATFLSFRYGHMASVSLHH